MATKTIDIKGLEHTEREALIFPGVDALKPGETLRIVVEFNPVPLAYMLRAKGGIEVAYEKEGPDEWVLLVSRVASEEEKRQQFRELLTDLRGGATGSARERARALLQEVDAKTLGTLEQELINEGVTHEEIRKSLCDVHLEVMKDALVSKRMEVSAPHPIHTFMEEHKIIVANLTELASLTARLKQAGSFEEFGDDLERLKDVSYHLVEAESHHHREEEALFPAVESHDITEPPEIMKAEHVEFRKKKRELYNLAQDHGQYSFDEFKRKVVELGEYLPQELQSHIFKEDNILYQIALQVLSPEEWVEVKRLCDQLGYCCFTPGDRTAEKAVTTA